VSLKQGVKENCIMKNALDSVSLAAADLNIKKHENRDSSVGTVAADWTTEQVEFYSQQA
jgi:hypothetical protein